MIHTPPVSGMDSEFSDISVTEPTNVETTESNIATFYSIMDSLFDEPPSSLNGSFNTKLGVAQFTFVNTEGPVDVYEIGEALVESPETTFVEYEEIDTLPFEVSRIFNYYGETKKIYLLELKDQAFLSIGDKFLSIKK